MHTFENDKKIEIAIKFLVHNVNESGHNPKPVIMHSIRVGLRLYNAGYPTDIVMAALLHDLLEDTDTKLDEIRVKFGGKVARLVEATTFDQQIPDKTERYKENFERAYKVGKEALIIRATDILDNSNYYHLTDKDTQKWLYEKLRYFLEIANDIIQNEIIYKELVAKYEKLH